MLIPICRTGVVLVFVLSWSATAFAQTGSTLRKENELREQARKLESEGRFEAAIESLKNAMDLRHRRLKNKQPDTPQDRFWITQMRNKLLTARKSGVEYHDKWFDRRLEFHDGGKLADEIAKAKAALTDMTRRLGEKNAEVVAAREQLNKLQAERKSKLEELKQISRYRDKYYATGRIKDASVYARMSLRLRREIYGDDDLTVGIAAMEAARVELRTGETFGFNEKLLTLAQDVFTKLFGEHH